MEKAKNKKHDQVSQVVLENRSEPEVKMKKEDLNIAQRPQEDKICIGGWCAPEDEIPKGGWRGPEDEIPKGGWRGPEDEIPEGGWRVVRRALSR